MTEPSRDQPVGPAFHTLAFATREGAVQAFEKLIGLGVSPDDVSLFVHAKAADMFGEGDALDHDMDVGGRIGASVASLAGGAGGGVGWRRRLADRCRGSAGFGTGGGEASCCRTCDRFSRRYRLDRADFRGRSLFAGVDRYRQSLKTGLIDPARR